MSTNHLRFPIKIQSLIRRFLSRMCLGAFRTLYDAREKELGRALAVSLGHLVEHVHENEELFEVNTMIGVPDVRRPESRRLAYDEAVLTKFTFPVLYYALTTFFLLL